MDTLYLIGHLPPTPTPAVPPPTSTITTAAPNCSCPQAVTTASIITALATALVILLTFVVIQCIYKHRFSFKQGSNSGAPMSSSENTGITHNQSHGREMSSLDAPAFDPHNGEVAGLESEEQEQLDEDGSYAEVSDGYYMEVIQIEQNLAYAN